MGRTATLARISYLAMPGQRARKTLLRNWQIALTTALGIARGMRHRRSEFRHHVVRDVWTVLKRFGADAVVNVERRELACLWYYTVVEGPIDDSHRLLLAALAKGLSAKTFFEIGTNRGYTTWTVAHNNPDLRVLTLDIRDDHAPRSLELADDDVTFLIEPASRGEAFRNTPEAARITQLEGDSATFDFEPYHSKMDLIYIDGAHTYEYVMSDSRRALEMLAPGGTIAWDDYTSSPGVWRAVRDVARELPRPVYHIFGTRMAIYSDRSDFVRRRPYDDYFSQPF